MNARGGGSEWSHSQEFSINELAGARDYAVCPSRSCWYLMKLVASRRWRKSRPEFADHREASGFRDSCLGRSPAVGLDVANDRRRNTDHDLTFKASHDSK